MSTDASFIEYVCDQARGAGELSFRKMFGEYAFYCDGKVVALVCDNQVFLKPTDAGRTLLLRVREAAPYPGARPHWLIDETLDDGETWARLVAATAKALPAAKPKPQRKATPAVARSTRAHTQAKKKAPRQAAPARAKARRKNKNTR